MTKQEAIEAMKQGEKVTHRFFTPDEWIAISENIYCLTDESGCIINTREFWSYRTDESWNTDWSIYKK
ncbi:MAG: hypothetical protein Q7W13_14105 [Bacteroidia bacterium]|nr:hypothetical protein [Bacteroidia bacterium]